MKLTLLLRYFAKLLIPTIRLLPKEFQNLFITFKKEKVAQEQCDQIGQFIGLCATF